MIRLATAAAFACSCCVHAAERAPPMLNLTLSQASIFESYDDDWRYGIEYRFRPIGAWEIFPVAGISTAANGATFVYVDGRREFMLTRDAYFTFSFGAGRFDPDDVLDLGHMLEFRTGLVLGHRFRGEWRVELGVFHFSNGGLSNRNPGTEAAVLTLGIPLD